MDIELHHVILGGIFATTIVTGIPRLIQQSCNAVCFELAGRTYWTSLKSWAGRNTGVIEVA